jgi:hypothetical protein
MASAPIHRGRTRRPPSRRHRSAADATEVHPWETGYYEYGWSRTFKGTCWKAAGFSVEIFGVQGRVAFDGVQASSRYPGGLALRLARVVRYRDDKSPAAADTIDTVRALY